jgi:hypothetical protein
VATVRASCPTCGDVKLTTRDVQVQVGYTSGLNSYSFLCPSCRLLVNKEATDLIMETLVAAGVRVITWTRPAELDELKLGPRITHDDLLAFHFDLDGPLWLETQVALIGTEPRSRTT